MYVYLGIFVDCDEALYIAAMLGELAVLRLVSERLDVLGTPYMLTGSFALAYYATPRMTRDLDLVVALRSEDIVGLEGQFAADFYLDRDAAESAVTGTGMFNILHLESGIKVDLIIRRSDSYRRKEFERRSQVDFGGVDIWIVSREDLILSKLVWARGRQSDLQRADVRSLLDASVDREYLCAGRMNWKSSKNSEIWMIDTPPEFQERVAERYRQMSPAQRVHAADEMFRTARAIVESSLPKTLSRRERRLAILRRFYADELPEDALCAAADYPEGN